MRHNQTRTHLHRICVNVEILDRPLPSSMTGSSLIPTIQSPVPRQRFHCQSRAHVLLLASPEDAAMSRTTNATSLPASVGVMPSATVMVTAVQISLRLDVPNLPLSHPSQHHQGHVKLLASAPAVGGVAEAATSLLADVGVIVLAVATETAVPTSVQPAQDQGGEVGVMRRLKRYKTSSTKPTMAQPDPRPLAVQQLAIMGAVLEMTARLSQAATVM